MKKLMIGLLSLMFLVSLVGAYPSYHDDYYNTYRTTTSWSRGYTDGPSWGRTSDYERVNSYRYLGDGRYQQVTSEVKTITYDDNYYWRGNYDRYPRYSYYYDYNPWYQKYWDYDYYYPSYRW